MNERKSGILLHITSLPGKYGIGTLGDEAYKFVDFLVETNQTYWQILPIGHTGFGDSPYSSYSAFAGNPLLINLDNLSVSNNTIKEYSYSKVDYKKVKETKFLILEEAAEIFIKSDIDKNDYENFIKENDYWLKDYCFFIALKEKYDSNPLWMFDENLKLRQIESLKCYSEKLNDEILKNQVIQFFFFSQWFKLKNYANNKGIKIIGDLPLYVAGDSADVWVNPEIFMLNEDLSPLKVAGVPPDYFSKTGQLWGNPVFDWKALKKSGYKWWKERVKKNLELFDIVRIDHFRGFSEFWAIPFENDTAEFGEWLPGPEDEFLDQIFEQNIRIIAEDLGIISNNVIRLLKKYDLPGMKILQFAFNSGSNNAFLPHNYSVNCVAYTGTHDNNTSSGMYESYSDSELKFLKDYLDLEKNSFAHQLVKYAWASVANTAIAPLQDILELAGDCRMNIPGTIGDNWEWKFEFNDIKDEHKQFLKRITEIYGRI